MKIKLHSTKLFGKRGKVVTLDIDKSFFFINEDYYKEIQNNVVQEKLTSLVLEEIKMGNWSFVDEIRSKTTT